MWKSITEYQLHWRNDISRGEIRIFTDDGSSYVEMTKVTSEFMVMADILRNEKPLWYHTEKHYISSGKEPAGEGERHDSPFGFQ
jgi:hypothetical protein